MDRDRIKTIIYIVIGVVIGAVLTIIFSHGKMSHDMSAHTGPGTEERTIKYWTCSMHPQVKMDHKDLCPICGMDLIPIYEGGGEGSSDVNLKLGERAKKLAAIKTAPVKKMALRKEITTVAKIDYDETKVAYISAWNDGRIDTLYADFTGMDVKTGDKLARLYSPALISAQQEYLLTYKTRGANAKTKLKLLGISEKQIKKIEKAGQPLTHLTITSPITGTVIVKNIKKGQYVKTGNLIYTIADLSNVWVYMDIYEYDLAGVRVGQHVSLYVEAYPDEMFEGVITFVDPFLNEKTRTVKVRVNIDNKERKLKPGLFATGHIHDSVIGGKDEKVLAVKREAVLDTGVRKVVFVEVDDGEFEMREVTTGPLADGYFPVTEGVKEGEKVVVSGNFLIDSQMQLSGKPSIMFPEGLAYDPHAAMGHGGGHEGHDNMDMDDISMDDMDMDDITMDDMK
jgi:Cu(I)/Ag(I) efflux system membrane fusion protein